MSYYFWGEIRMKINCLTDSKIKSFKPEKKSDGTFKKATFRDGDGLSLVVTPAGSKIWKLDFYCLKGCDSMPLGNYPALFLKDARQKRDAAKALAKEGINPKHAAKEVQQERKRKALERMGGDRLGAPPLPYSSRAHEDAPPPHGSSAASMYGNPEGIEEVQHWRVQVSLTRSRNAHFPRRS